MNKITELKRSVQHLKNVISNNSAEKITEEKEEKQDVDNISVCVFNQKEIDLFKKINAHEEVQVYVGLNSNSIAISKIINDKLFWQPLGTKVIIAGQIYESNCDISDSKSFDDMRFIMYRDNIIDSYSSKLATLSEMNDVLNFAFNYFDLDKMRLKK